MIFRIFIVIFFLFSTTFAWYYGRPDPGLMTQGGVWPLPWSITYSNDSFSINPSTFQFTTSLTGCQIIDRAFQRYRMISFPGYKSSTSFYSGKATSVNSVSITVSSGCSTDYPQLGMNESYSIDSTSSNGSVITANSVWGALRALESFSHLIYKDTSGQWWLRQAKISDSPRFPHRGIMLDSARHYLSVNMIKRNLELMAQNKMNVFHWHLVDTEAFPYTSTKYPDMSAKGAYTPKHVYSVAQIQDIIDFARDRGIRVIPEFDTPGHAGGWHGFPGLLSACFDHLGNSMLPNIIDPTQTQNWDFLSNFFGEALDLFKDNFFHFGGDEVLDDMLQCWSRNKNVSNWMEANNMGNDTSLLLNYYYKNLVQRVQQHKNTTIMIFWEEVFDMNVAPNGSVAHAWKGETMKEIMDEMFDITSRGHRAILSTCWYLNYIRYGPDWGYINGNGTMTRGSYYECDPTNFNGTAAQTALVLGGEAPMWGEYVDGTNLIPRMWPRASAVAERLWSDPAQTTSADAAWPRLHEFRCRMMSRGYEVEPPNNPDYCPDFWDVTLPDYSNANPSTTSSPAGGSTTAADNSSLTSPPTGSSTTTTSDACNMHTFFSVTFTIIFAFLLNVF
jgi:hexosaminidase